MTKLYKRTFRAIIVTSILSLFIYIFLLSDLNWMFKNSKFIQLNKEINIAKDVNELTSIVNLYNEIHESDNKCPCELATHYIDNYSIFKPSISKTIYNLKLKRQFQDNDCLKFLLSRVNFPNQVVGVKEVSKRYFKKSLNELDQEQKISLLVMFQNPSFYNPYRRAKKIQQKVEVYQTLINNKNGS